MAFTNTAAKSAYPLMSSLISPLTTQKIPPKNTSLKFKEPTTYTTISINHLTPKENLS
jgi:hypothetical protein